MTQAFNLAQFANYLNSSGQVSTSGLQSGIATQWTTTGSNIYYSSGHVLIQGTTTPSDYLTIVGGSYGLLVGARSFLASPSGDTAIGGLAGSNFTDIYAGGVRNARFTGGSFQFNSGYGSVATAYGCRAWVNFDGFTMGIRASGNVSSVTDNGVGNYALNFSSAMPDGGYGLNGMCGQDNTGNSGLRVCNGGQSVRSTTSCQILVSAIASGINRLSVDDNEISVTVYR